MFIYCFQYDSPHAEQGIPDALFENHSDFLAGGSPGTMNERPRPGHSSPIAPQIAEVIQEINKLLPAVC